MVKRRKGKVGERWETTDKGQEWGATVENQEVGGEGGSKEEKERR